MMPKRKMGALARARKSPALARKRNPLAGVPREMLEAKARGEHPNAFLGPTQVRISPEQVKREIRLMKKMGYSKREIAVSLARHNPYAVIEALLR